MSTAVAAPTLTQTPLKAIEPAREGMDRKLLFLLTLTAVICTGNVYFAQPLLGRIATEFGRAPGSVGFIPTLSQLGYVSGLLFLTPLGDSLEKKKLLVSLLIAASVGLFLFAVSPTFAFLSVSAFLIGLTAVLTQILIPFVAVLSTPKERGKNLGVLLSGALIGVLISRTLSGVLGEHIGWRGVFFVASATMLIFSALLAIVLPKHEPETRLSYHRLLHSVWLLYKRVPGVRAIAINGALCYGALSGFWASLAFYLQSPAYHQGPALAGEFGLVGAVGALGANISGRYSERIGSRKLVQICVYMMMAAFLILMFFGKHLSGMIAGVIVLDLFAQSATVSNQTQLYTLNSDAKTRLNTIYKMFYFTGGAIGSAVSAISWQHFGWNGVCGAALLFLLAALAWERISPLSQ
ncbi:MAG: MFS transporter [Bdellovibrionia bacterium]